MDRMESKKKRKKTLISAIISGILSFLICFLLYKNEYFGKRYYELSDFELSGIKVEGNAISTENAPQMISEFENPQFVQSVNISIDNISSDSYKFQVFWDSGDGFSEDNSYAKEVSQDDTNISLKVNKKITAIRLDWGDEEGREVIVDGITIMAFDSRMHKNLLFVWAFFAFLSGGICFRIDSIFNKHEHNLNISVLIYRIVCSIVVVASIVFSVNAATYCLSVSSSYNLRLGYYESDDCDVLLLGTSHMFDGIYPMEMWKNNGISSYNLSMAGERLAMTYYSFLDALRYHTPKVVVIDVHGLEYGNVKNDIKTPKRCHDTFDAIKWSKIKIEGIKDCVSKELWPDFFFPLSFYHDRWDSLGEADIKKRGSRVEYSRGARYGIGVANASAPTLLDITDYSYTDNYSTIYLQKIIDVCDERNIKVLLLYIPFPADQKSQRKANMAYELAKKNDNTEYINLLYFADDIGLDYSIDTYDSDSHLNPFGARKVSRYVGNYLVDNYDLNDYCNDSEWIETYSSYLQEVSDKLFVETEDLNQYLMLMSNSDYYSVIYESAENKVADYELQEKLINNIKSYSSVELLNMSDLVYEDYQDKVNLQDKLVIEIYKKEDNSRIDCSVWDMNDGRVVITE